MAKFTGIKLNFSNPEAVGVECGEKIIPHRVDLIRENLDSGNLDGILSMFFNFELEDCKVASTREHIEIENELFERYLKMTENITE